MASGFQKPDPLFGSVDLDDEYLTDAWLVDRFVGNRLFNVGQNDKGQMGNGTGTYYSSPIQVGALTNWKQICYGNYHWLGLKTDGSLWSCGYNAFYGAMGVGNIDANYSSPVQVGALTSWSQISAGRYHSAALKTDGTLWTWGYNGYGTLGNGTISHYSSPIQIGSLTDWKSLSVSGTAISMAAIKTDGTLWTWGDNRTRQLGNGSTTSYFSSPIQIGSLTNWKQVAMGSNSSAAIKTDGTLWTWGENATAGQLGNGTITNYSSPIQIGSLTNWKQVAVGNYFMMAIKIDGTLWAWGANTWGATNYGTLGNGLASTNYSSPIQIGSLNNWKQVSCGYSHWSAVKTDGTLWSCGFNQFGQLGNNTRIYYSSPIQVGSLTNWKQVSAGGNAIAAIPFSDI